MVDFIGIVASGKPALLTVNFIIPALSALLITTIADGIYRRSGLSEFTLMKQVEDELELSPFGR